MDWADPRSKLQSGVSARCALARRWASKAISALAQGMPAKDAWQQLMRKPVWADSSATMRFALSLWS